MWQCTTHSSGHQQSVIMPVISSAFIGCWISWHYLLCISTLHLQYIKAVSRWSYAINLWIGCHWISTNWVVYYDMFWVSYCASNLKFIVWSHRVVPKKNIIKFVWKHGALMLEKQWPLPVSVFICRILKCITVFVELRLQYWT